MRFAIPLCVLVCATILSGAASAAIGLEETLPAPQPPSVAVSEFSEGTAQYADAERNRRYSFEEKKRARLKRQITLVVLLVAPVVLLGGVTLFYARSRSDSARRRAIQRSLKHSEGRRRSGGGEKVLDPRQW